MKQLILLELNEINFDTAAFYIDRGEKLPTFEKILKNGLLKTKSEKDYHLLEPWIQWPSVHMGKTYSQHKIYRLGDVIDSGTDQIFEKIERAGFKVGAISPMNASNNMDNPAYFIPDPWTNTATDGSFFSNAIASAISQAVNDNAKSKLTMKTIFVLILAFMRFIDFRKLVKFIKFAISARKKSWRKALFLDLFLFELHKTLFKLKKPNFSTLFLNAGAHIQHHYFFNSPYVSDEKERNPSWYITANEDPVLEMLQVYDGMLAETLNRPDTECIVATGLSQKPYEKLKYYYRLSDHEKFLSDLQITFSSVVPRMTRDFLISFENAEETLLAEEKLSEVLVNGNVRLFDEIDNRGEDLFVVLTYPNEVTGSDFYTFAGSQYNLKSRISFVAIKNGEHQEKGYVYFSEGVAQNATQPGAHVSQIHFSILNYFGLGVETK